MSRAEPGTVGGADLDSSELARCIVDAVVDRQGEDVILLDISKVSILADYFVICSASSERQANAIIEGAQEVCRSALGARPLRVEGEPADGWVLIDYGSVVVHLFAPEARRYYQLEELWHGGRVVVRVQ